MRPHPTVPLLATLVLFATWSASAQITTRASLTSTCNEGNALSVLPSLSTDGRYVAFVTLGSNFAAHDSNGQADVYVLDRVTGSTTLASVNTGIDAGNGTSSPCAISGNGRYVAFRSTASDLVAGDTNTFADIFVRDLVAGTTIRASLSSAGVQANGDCVHPDISADGRFVVFESLATNLVPGDTNGVSDSFLRDRDPDANGIFDEGNETTTRVSVGPGGIQSVGGGGNSSPAISADGAFIAFDSDSATFDVTDTNGTFDVFVYDRIAQTVSRASVGPGGVQGNGNSSDPRLSADGRYVSFLSGSTNFAASDPNGNAADVFVRDRSGATTSCASLTPIGATGNAGCTAAWISGDGRYVALASTASDLVAGDTNGFSDVFERDLLAAVTRLVTAPAGGTASDGASDRSTISGNGVLIAYQTTATNLAPGDFAGQQDVLVCDSGRGTAFSISFCAGDGTGAPCPCGNSGLPGHGCDNSIATGGARLTFAGRTVPDTIELVSTGQKPGGLTIFLQGTTASVPGVAFGDGLRCVSGNLKRLLVTNANSLGAAVLPRCPFEKISTLSANLGDPIAPGTARYYMTYYRDPDPAFCPIPTGNTWNASQAIGLNW